MTSQANTRTLSILRLYVNAASVIAISIGIIVMLGWFFDIQNLKSVIPNAATMKFNTALCFSLTGISLWLLRSEENRSKKPYIGKIIASLVVVLGSLTLSEYLFSWGLGIDQFFMQDTGTLPGNFPGRMSQITAIGFILGGLALL
jgi:hypothetical protein